MTATSGYRVRVVPPDDIERLKAELAVWEERKQRAVAAQGPPLLRNKNRFFNGLLHGDLDTLDRETALRAEIKRCDERIDRLLNTLSTPVNGAGGLPREEPRGDLDRRALSANVRREKKPRRSADRLLADIRTTRKRIGQASRHRARDDASRSVVDEDAKELRKLLGDVRRGVAKLQARTPTGVQAKLDSVARLHVPFSGSAVDHQVRAQEYADATRALDALAREVAALRDTLVFRETEARRVKRTGSR